MLKVYLKDCLPDFVGELERLLLEEDRPELACQVRDMPVDVGRCVISEEFCAMLCTGLQPSKGWGAGQTTIALAPRQGNILVDVIDGEIIAVEVFCRKDVHERMVQMQYGHAQPGNASESVSCGGVPLAG
ncbi:hypothetical protein F6V25_07010 [Oryzomonas japonica]|uniref:Uncharacterized protein n=1 Tax=Oryzomonas japonica TaxID=2603858 RepID=A0A7J4ZTT4_9BACT|nr:hypothetical protein [Oryzomonas japonica]KAB0666215.1 hypothetical protein F6V25_07010 [Oryzomonas japonica]